MSLFGALNAGVSGLTAQSSAMGAIADNITNVNTVGYKETETSFMTLVTAQASSTFHSAGGVQARPLTLNGAQGLLQSTTSQTDLAISGGGFFLVNEASRPGSGDEFLYTRAGSFYKDEQGYLRNTAGYYLQGWPVDAQGKIVLPSGSGATQTNQNIISSDFLDTVNLDRVGGTATPTSNIALGANLPASAAVGDQHTIDVRLFNSLGNATGISFQFTKTAANQWDLRLEPPSRAAAATVYDSSGTGVYQSVGQLEFAGEPSTWAPGTTSVDINGTTYTYGTASWPNAGVTNLADAVAGLIASVKATDGEFAATTGNHVIATKAGDPTTVIITGGTVTGGAAEDVTVDISNLKDASGNAVTAQGASSSIVANASTFVVKQKTVIDPAIQFNADGVPMAFNAGELALVGFTDGAGDMNETDINSDGIADIHRISLDLGTPGEPMGITQFGGDFTPGFTQQNGAQFGSFTGLSVAEDGLVTAIFDNGQMRPIFQLPVVTFTSPTGLSSRSGNVFNATAASGEPILRVANTGPAGTINQSALEGSTVDIGGQFSDMIIVQRAYSASTRVISTSDEMLEELMRIKR